MFSGELKRSVVSVLAAMVAAAIPTLVTSPAMADKPAEKADTAVDAGKQVAKKAKGRKSKLNRSPKATSASKATKSKKVASRSAKKKTAKKPPAEAPPRRCLGRPVSIDRGGLEAQSFPLVDCHGRPLAAAGETLSVLARPWGAAKPAGLHPAPRLANGEIAPGIRVLDKGLLTRLNAVARHFDDRRITLVSGYRPQSQGSLHQSAHALDLRVAGVRNEELSAFCKTLPDTGCGYYPNSSFVHVDVRKPGTGTVWWIDSSGPGEAPHYVQQWPPPPDLAVLPPDAEAHDPYEDLPAAE